MKKNRRGQASTEYILMLAIVTLVALTVKRALTPYIDGLSRGLSTRIEEFWSKGDPHNLKLSR